MKTTTGLPILNEVAIFSFGLLLFLLVLRSTFGWSIDNQLFNDSPRDLYLASPASGHWATISRYGFSPANHGYDPQSTVMYSSWQPVVKEVAPHRWQVTFILPHQQ